MFALSNRPFRNAGLAFYGLGSLASLGMISDQASAQTLANNSQAPAGVTRSDTCDHHFKDRTPAGIEKYVQCEIREIDRRIAASQHRTAAIVANAQRETACQEILIKGIEGGRIQPSKVNAIYGDRPVGSISACKVLEQLGKS